MINERDEFIELLCHAGVDFSDYEKTWFPEEKTKCWDVEIPELEQIWHFKKSDGSLFRVTKTSNPAS